MTLIKRSLAGHEEIIEAGIRSFIDVGNSLMAIRDEHLYLERRGSDNESQYKDFDEYCRERWGFGRSYAYRLMESAVVVRDLSPKGDNAVEVIPQNERQARALADAAHDAKARKIVWVAAVAASRKDKSGKPKVSASTVKRVAAQILGPPKNDAQHPLPIPERQPGEDAPEAEHTVVPGTFDDALIDTAFGKLIRLVDARANALGHKNGAYHKACLTRLGDFLRAMNLWRAAYK